MQRLLNMIAASTMMLMTQASAAAEPGPFDHGDAAQGKPLVERDCVACHASRFEGKPEQMYLRPDRRVRTPAQLLAQVRYCNAQLNTQYFPDDEEHVAA